MTPKMLNTPTLRNKPSLANYLKNGNFQIVTIFIFLWTNSAFVSAEGDCESVSKDPGLVRFFLYNQVNSGASDSRLAVNSSQQLIYTNLSTIHDSNLKLSNGFIFLTHGFNSNYTSSFPQKVKNAYLENDYDDNIIVVDWGFLAKPRGSLLTNYHCAVHNVPVVANEIVGLISALLDNNLISDVSSFHLVGFSLGAHVSGLVGRNMQAKYAKNIGRITGLDPAGPLFTTDTSSERHLQSSDADFVDVVHTNKGEYGIVEAVGHADFYVNGGGPKQPGCKFHVSCAHRAAPNYFMQSIGNKNILACDCRNFIYCWIGHCHGGYDIPFGENAKPGTFGKFYLEMRPIADFR